MLDACYQGIRPQLCLRLLCIFPVASTQISLRTRSVLWETSNPINDLLFFHAWDFDFVQPSHSASQAFFERISRTFKNILHEAVSCNTCELFFQWKAVRNSRTRLGVFPPKWHRLFPILSTCSKLKHENKMFQVLSGTFNHKNNMSDNCIQYSYSIYWATLQLGLNSPKPNQTKWKGQFPKVCFS